MKAGNSAANGITGEKFALPFSSDGDLFFGKMDGLVTDAQDGIKGHDIGAVNAHKPCRGQLGQDGFHGHPYYDGFLVQQVDP